MIANSATHMIQKLSMLWHRFTFARYFGASVVALIIDSSIYGIAILATIMPSIAAALGYSAGIVIHWMVSSNFVFIGKKKNGAKLQLQRALFAGSALLGLGLTIAIVQMLTTLGSGPILAKIAAVGVSFIAVYAARKWGVFR